MRRNFNEATTFCFPPIPGQVCVSLCLLYVAFDGEVVWQRASNRTWEAGSLVTTPNNYNPWDFNLRPRCYIMQLQLMWGYGVSRWLDLRTWKRIQICIYLKISIEHLVLYNNNNVSLMNCNFWSWSIQIYFSITKSLRQKLLLVAETFLQLYLSTFIGIRSPRGSYVRGRFDICVKRLHQRHIYLAGLCRWGSHDN